MDDAFMVLPLRWNSPISVRTGEAPYAMEPGMYNSISVPYVAPTFWD